MVCCRAVAMLPGCFSKLFFNKLFPKLHALDDGMKVMASAGGWAPGICVMPHASKEDSKVACRRGLQNRKLGQIRPCILYNILAYNPIFSVRIYFLVVLSALHNPNPGSDPHTNVWPQYVSTGVCPGKKMKFVGAVGALQPKLSESMEKTEKSGTNRSDCRKTVQTHSNKGMLTKFLCHVIYTNRCCWFSGLREIAPNLCMTWH